MQIRLTSLVVVTSLSLLTITTGVLAVRKMISEGKKQNQIAALGVAVGEENNGCIVTISGKKYNVTELQKTHSGGDIFNCGTDMTDTYIGQHGQDLSRLDKYLVGNVGIGVFPINTITPTLGNKCLITIFGNKYDVTVLKSTHSGGDIFNCGTDMTSTYTKQHGTSLTRMQKYLVSAASITNTPTLIPTANNTKCIVTINSKQYDVTNLRNTHSGGDIFNCGTDMTSTFNGKHGTNWNLISKYLITVANAANPTAVPTASTNNNQCIVTVSGNQYDVTTLRTTHSGGNIFACGTDMTSTFNGKHGNNLALISRYLITGGAPRPTTVTSNNNTGTCIITINSKQYDVTRFRTKHKGGDVFACGADNTAIFNSQHGTKYDMLKDYLVGGSGGGDDDD